MSDKKKPSDTSDAALKARLAQLELENRMRMQNNQPSMGANPIKDTPRKGFGSAQGIAHLRHTEFQRRGPNPPVPPTPIPEPGKARFGGTYLKTPLPGIIPADATPGNELIAPVPATPTAPAPAPAKDPRVQPIQGGGLPPRPPSSSTGIPSGVMPSGRAMPPGKEAPPPSPGREVAQAKPTGPIPAAAQFDPQRSVIGGSSLTKAPLPALYHAGMKAAENAEKLDKAGAVAKPAGPATPESMAKPAAELVIPEGSEVTKEGPKAPRVKRFKNPTLGPGPAKD